MIDEHPRCGNPGAEKLNPLRWTYILTCCRTSSAGRLQGWTTFLANLVCKFFHRNTHRSEFFSLLGLAVKHDIESDCRSSEKHKDEKDWQNCPAWDVRRYGNS